MNKALSVIIAFLVCILAIGFGYVYYDNKITSTIAEASDKYNNEQHSIEKELADNEYRSAVDWINYRAYKNGDTGITMAVLGSSVTKGAGASTEEKNWNGLLQTYLEGRTSTQIILKNHGYGGYTTTRLLKEKKVDAIVKDKPDLVIFEITTINNFDHGISASQTETESKEIYNKIRKALPNSLIIVQNSHEIEELAYRNYDQYAYDDFNRKITDYAKTQNWNYVDVYDTYKSKVMQEGLNYKNLLSDGIHPNDNGYNIWFSILKSYFSNQKIKQ